MTESVLPSRVQPQKVPAAPALLSDVFIDESSQTKHRFLALGGIIIPTMARPSFEEEIWNARGSDLPAGELAWTKVSKAKLDAYKRVVDVFFQTRALVHPVEFHSLYVDTTKIRDAIFNSGSREIGFNKDIYQICIKFARLHPGRLLHVYLDKRDTKHSTEELRLILNRGIRKTGDARDWPYRRLHFRNSADCQCIQLVDVLLGAVGFHINGHRIAANASPAKCALSDYILHQRAKIRVAINGTPRTGKFTIWERKLL